LIKKKNENSSKYRILICHFLPPIFRKFSSQNFKILSKTHPISTAHDHRSSPSIAVRRPPLFAAHRLRPFPKSSPLHRTSPPSNESIAAQRHPSTTAALRHPGASATDPRYFVAVSSSAARFSSSLQPTHLSLASVTCFGATHSLSLVSVSLCAYIEYRIYRPRSFNR
jgi:hypothetical protein